MRTDEGDLLPDLEPLMGVDAFSQTAVSKGIRAAAARVVNLLFQEKGTCYDDYDMGVGIKLYLFERQNKVSGHLEAEIHNQIKEYITDVNVGNVEATFVSPRESKKSVAGMTLVIKIEFKEPIEGKNYLAIKMRRTEGSNIETSFFTD